MLSQEYIDFFKDLAANNNRDWFKPRKKAFERSVREPFYTLTQAVIDRMKEVDPEIAVDVRDCVFRIYRDIRFSKDKAPYKLHMAAAVGRGGRKDLTHPGVYFQVDAEGVSIAGGAYRPAKAHLYNIRQAIAQNPKRFQDLLQDGKFAETFEGIQGERNKRIPKEFREAGEIVPEIYNKSFHYWKTYNGPGYILREDLDRFIVQHYIIAAPFNAFLAEAMQGHGA